MKQQDYVCKKCGNHMSAFMFIQKSGPHTGLYCGECGAFIKWITKDEKRLLTAIEGIREVIE